MKEIVILGGPNGAVAETDEGSEMRVMSSRQIHNAIRGALSEVSAALASGEMDRSGRFYSDSELKERLGSLVSKGTRKRRSEQKSPRRTAKSA